MNNHLTLAVVAASIAFAALADSSVSDVVARQRWPWSETVDIDYTVTGDRCDVDFTATWDGQPTPVLLGTAFQAEAGQHRFEWCPTNSYAGQTLTGFTVAAETASFNDHLYLVLDLANGGYSYTNAAPAGGWTAEHKSTKMVFRRIPAGTYRLGYTEAQMTYLNYGVQPSQGERTAYGTRTATFSSDFYIAIYKLSKAQYDTATGSAASNDYTARSLTYDEIRGATNAFVNWPDTKYAVAGGSFAAALRAKAGGSLLIDLPEEEQWEAAVRADTTTFWPNGGTVNDDYESLTNFVNAIACWNGGGQQTPSNSPIGSKAPSGFGLYDVVGLGYTEWTLDSAATTGSGSVPRYAPQDRTDPVGSEFFGKRIIRSQSGASRGGVVSIYNMGLAFRQLVKQDYGGATARFAIHLKPLNFGN